MSQEDIKILVLVYNDMSDEWKRKNHCFHFLSKVQFGFTKSKRNEKVFKIQKIIAFFIKRTCTDLKTFNYKKVARLILI